MLWTHGLDFMTYEFPEVLYWLVCLYVRMYVCVYIKFSGVKEDFYHILSVFEFKKSHSNIAISMEKHDIYNHLSQYFSSPFVPHLWPLCLNLLGPKKTWLFVVICWPEKWAPTKPRQPVFMIIYLHQSIREPECTVADIRRAYVIFHMIFLKL